MKRLLLVFMVLFFGIVSAQGTQTVAIEVSDIMQKKNGKEYYVHVVRQGQTLFSISRAYGLKYYDAIIKTDIHLMKVGDTVWLPKNSNSVAAVSARAKSAVAPETTVHYIRIEPGQTLYGLSKLYGVPIEKIVEANPELKTEQLKAGQMIKIPPRDPNFKPAPEEPKVKTTEKTAEKPAAKAVDKKAPEETKTKTTEKPVEKPAAKVTEKPVMEETKAKTTEKPVEKSAAKVTEKPAPEEPKAKATEKPAEKPAAKVMEKPAPEEPKAKASEKPAEKPATKVTEKPASEETKAKVTEKPAEKPAAKATEKPATEETKAKVTDKPAEKPAAKATEKPAPEEPKAKATEKPVEKLADKSKAEKKAKKEKEKKSADALAPKPLYEKAKSDVSKKDSTSAKSADKAAPKHDEKPAEKPSDAISVKGNEQSVDNNIIQVADKTSDKSSEKSRSEKRAERKAKKEADRKAADSLAIKPVEGQSQKDVAVKDTELSKTAASTAPEKTTENPTASASDILSALPSSLPDTPTPLTDSKQKVVVNPYPFEEQIDLFPIRKAKFLESDTTSDFKFQIRDRQDKNKIFVSIIMPLNLDKIDEISTSKFDIEQRGKKEYKVFEFVQFYEGILMALDQLQAQGIDIVLNVVDLPSDKEKDEDVVEAFYSHQMENSDIIIALLVKKPFNKLAQLAKKHQVFVINPFSSRVEVVADNPYVVKCMPSVEGNVEGILDRVARKYKDGHLYIVHSNSKNPNYEESIYRNEFVKQLDARKDIKYTLFDWNASNKLVSALKTTHNNVIVSVYDQGPKQNSLFMRSLLSKLAQMKSDVPTVFTLLNYIKDVPNIEYDQLQYVNYTLTTIGYLDYAGNTKHRQFVDTYKEKFHTEPNPLYAGTGHDIMLFFASALWQKGAAFWQNPQSFDAPSQMLFPFKLKQSTPQGGYENTMPDIYQMIDYKLIKN